MTRLIIAVLCLVFVVGCANIEVAQVDTDYGLALATANKFLVAWRGRRQGVGLALLSPRLRMARTDDEWRMAISGVSNPHHQSYEIAGGKRLPDGRLQFNVWLHDHYTGERLPAAPRRTPQHIILIKAREEGWQVDRVPQL